MKNYVEIVQWSKWDHPTPENIKQELVNRKSNLYTLGNVEIAKRFKPKCCSNALCFSVHHFSGCIRYWILQTICEWRWKGTLLSSHLQITCHTIEFCLNFSTWAWCIDSINEDITTIKTGTRNWGRYLGKRRLFLDTQPGIAELY